MKKFIFLVVACLAFGACTDKVGKEYGGFTCLVPDAINSPGLYRYVDKEYGVIIYVSDNHRMTSQPLKRDKNP